MSKLTKRQQSDLADILRHVSRAERMILSPRYEIAMVDAHATTSLHFTNPAAPDRNLYPICKDIGSDLTGIFEARRLLERMLAAGMVA